MITMLTTTYNYYTCIEVEVKKPNNKTICKDETKLEQ